MTAAAATPASTRLTATVDQIVVSPLNVRKCDEDAQAVDALAASIAHVGLLEPLIVHPCAGEPWAGHAIYAALAGGRRLRAIRSLVDAGTLPPDWPIEASLRDPDDAEIIELSLAENLLRRDLRSWEQHQAVAAAYTAAADLPEGDYATVEVLGHRTLIGRVTEVDRFGAKMLQVEPLFGGLMLGPVLLGGASIYQFTPCTREAAFARRATDTYQLPASVVATIPPALLPSPARSLIDAVDAEFDDIDEGEGWDA